MDIEDLFSHPFRSIKDIIEDDLSIFHRGLGVNIGFDTKIDRESSIAFIPTFKRGLYQKLKGIVAGSPYLRIVQEQSMDQYPHHRLFYGAGLAGKKSHQLVSRQKGWSAILKGTS